MEKNKGVAGSSSGAEVKKLKMRLPITICCSTCGNYVYKKTVLNSNAEVFDGKKFPGSKIDRWYTNCTKCSAEFIITSESDEDYVVESGAVRVVEPVDEVVAEEQRRRDTKKSYEFMYLDPNVVIIPVSFETKSMKVIEEEQRRRDAEDMGDTLMSLENRTLDSKREILSALNEKLRHATVSVDAILEALQRSAPVQVVEEEQQRRDAEDMGDTLMFLENRTLDSKREILSALDEKLRHATVSVNAILEALQRSALVQKRKVSHEVSHNPTDYLTKTERIKIGVPAPNAKTRANENEEQSHQQEEKAKIRSNGIQLLCHQYDIDEEE